MNLRNGLLDIGPLRSSHHFRRQWVGMSLGALAHQVATVAVLFQVWELTNNPFWTGAIGLATAIPLITFGLWGGVLADVCDRRRLIVWTTLGQLLAVLGLAAQALVGVGSVLVVLALVATSSGCGATGAAARRTLPSRLLVREQVAAGVALTHLGFQAAMLTGPALGGLAIARSGVEGAYLATAVGVAAALYAAGRLPSLPPRGEPQRTGIRALIDGVREVVRRPVIRGSFGADLFATVLAMPIALFPMINDLRFGGDPQTLGLFLSAIAVGGIAASAASGAITRAARPGQVQLGAGIVWGLALAGVGVARTAWLALALLVVAGAADTVSVVSRGAMVQLATPDDRLGRISSVEHVIGLAGPNVGNFRAGIVAGLASPAVALVSGGLACVAGISWIAARNRPLRSFSLTDAVD